MTLAIQSFNKSDLKNKILILGDMYELGKEEDKFHQEIVDYCKSLVIDRVIKKNGKAVLDFKSGDKNALNFLLGAVMKKTDRRADYKVTKDVLLRKLK